MLWEDAENGFCGLVYILAVTPRVHRVQFVKLMLMTLFWKNIRSLPCPSCKLIPRCSSNVSRIWVLLSTGSELEKQTHSWLIRAFYHFQPQFQEHNLMKYQFSEIMYVCVHYHLVQSLKKTKKTHICCFGFHFFSK